MACKPARRSRSRRRTRNSWRRRASMRVQVKLMAALRSKLPPGSTGGTALVDLPADATVAAALEKLGISVGAVHLVMVNGDMETDRSRSLADGDELVVFPPVA